MMKNIKRIISLMLAAAMLCCLLAGCGKSTANDEDTIKIMLSGKKPVGWDRVLAKYEETGAKETKVHINVEWVSQGDYKEKLNLRMIGSENYDIVFDAPFNKLKNFAAYEMYVPLEDYISSGQYPNLSKAFPSEIADANHYFGHLYGLPMMRTYGNGIDCVYYRKDMAKKYNIGNNGQIDSYDDLQRFFDAVMADSSLSGMVPFGVTASRGFYSLFRDDNNVELVKNHIVPMNLGATGYVILNEDNTQAVDIIYQGENTERYASLPEQFRDGEMLGLARLKKLREWNKYLERDSLNRKDAWAMVTGMKAAAMVDNLDTYEQKMTDFESALPEAELGVFIINDAVKNMEPEARVTNLQGNNFICIPAWSKKVDKALTFLDWLYANSSNHDLFELGVEGEDWKAIGDDRYEQIKSADKEAYSFPGYVMTWNPNYVRFLDTLDEDIYEYKKYDLDIKAYYESPLAGFMFDTSKLQTETTVVSGIKSEVETALLHGALDDPTGKLNANINKCLDNGLDVIRQEAIRQINEFLANKNK